MSKAARVINEARQAGLSPNNDESRSFADDYKEVAYALSDKLGIQANQFCIVRNFV